MEINNGAQTEIEILKAELEFERKMRHKVESLNQALIMELAEERKAMEEKEETLKLLESEVICSHAEIDKVQHEIEEERKMIRIAELWREERVQMKLFEAKLLMDEKLKEIGEFICLEDQVAKIADEASPTCQINRTGRKEVENPHITRGIKGFVEFPRTTRIQAKEERVCLEYNLECQRAQLRVLLRNKGSNCFMGVSQNLVL